MKEQVLAVQRMQDYIEKNRTEDITLSELAGASLFSPWYSYRLFREYIGLTPTEYIRKYRLTQAARRLRTGKVKVIDAAYDAGFSNADTFTRAFYREFGLNPGDYLNLSVKSGTVFGLLGAVGAVAICAGGLMGLPQAVSTMREYKILKRLRVTPVSPVFILGVELTMYIVYCSVSLAVLVVPAALFWHVRLRGSLLRFPMLVFSSTTLPLEVMPRAMQKIVSLFPLTQGITMMKNAFIGADTGSVLLPVCVMLGLTALCTALSIRFFRWE